MNRNSRGFTLIEVAIYLVIAVFLMSMAINFFILAVNSRIQKESVSGVEQEGQRALSVIIQTVRNGFAIEKPIFGNATSTLIIRNATSSTDITTFNLSGGQIYITGSSTAARPLTSNQPAVSNLLFSNITREGTPGAARIEFTMTGRNYSKKFYGSAAIRQ